jgi:acyl-coenzyme A synthetase/AMP-(fatty) acid ligase
VPSLAFDLLDRHVVQGRGDDIACSDDSGALTFAQLVERSAALAGGLRALGVTAGDAVAVSMNEGNARVVAICACVRLGAVPGPDGGVRIVEDADRVTVVAVGEVVDLTLVLKAGKSDPAPALPSDPPDYAAAVLENWPMLNTFYS